jgi:hypothetical protein
MTEAIANGVWRLELLAHTLPPFTHTNSYLVASEGEAVLKKNSKLNKSKVSKQLS